LEIFLKILNYSFMTKQSIEKIIQNNRRPIAVHSIWAEFEKMRSRLGEFERAVERAHEELDKLSPYLEEKNFVSLAPRIRKLVKSQNKTLTN